jgi:hypothetical protein
MIVSYICFTLNFYPILPDFLHYIGDQGSFGTFIHLLLHLFICQYQYQPLISRHCLLHRRRYRHYHLSSQLRLTNPPPDTYLLHL